MATSTTANLKDAEGGDRSELTRLFNQTRKRLVETGTRNRLIHVNRSNTRGNVINVVNERSDDVFSILSAGRVMRFLALGDDTAVESDRPTLVDLTQENVDPERHRDLSLETRFGPDALAKKLLKIHREAQTAEEESGVNILYLALGFLSWFEEKSSKIPREAPLILLPVELVRNARTSTYDLRVREEDVVTNLPLQQRLRDDFGLVLPDLDPEEGWTPSRYFAAVDAVASAREGWAVHPDAIHLGFFSFSKLLMYRDLAIEAWPDGALADHDLTKRLLYEGFDAEAPLFGPADRLDEVLPPEKIFHVVDADASQAKVIEEVRTGRNLVVQGPPGTGKSQTITNIIAAAVSEGKRVLFVAEKMAALSVVHDRLVKVGLRDACLELHSRNVSKKIVVTELARTLARANETLPATLAPVAIRETRDRLNLIDDVLHRPIGQTEETPYSILGLQARFMASGCAPPELDCATLSTLSRTGETRLLAIIKDYSEALKADAAEGDNPFEGARILDLQPVEIARLGPYLTGAHASVEALLGAFGRPLEALAPEVAPTLGVIPLFDATLERLQGLPAGSAATAAAVLANDDLSSLREALKTAVAWKTARNQGLEIFIETAFDAAIGDLRGALVVGSKSWFARWGSGYRIASGQLAGLLKGELPKAAADRIGLVDQLLRIEATHRLWTANNDALKAAFGPAWRGDRTDFGSLLTIVEWCLRLKAAPLQIATQRALELAGRPDALAEIRRALAERGPAARTALAGVTERLGIEGIGLPGDRTDLRGSAARLKAMAAAPDRYGSWVKLARPRDALGAAGFSALEARMRRRELDAESAAIELRFARAERLWRIALDQWPELGAVTAEKRHELVARFAALERSRFKDAAAEILAGHLKQVPVGALGEMKVLRGEIAKKRGHMALRRLFSKAGIAIQRIKPVLLMSPISVAQFIPPGALSFDLLVIDEASQVRPEDALGAVARAKQIVVVGDEAQLPPSSFFDRLLADEDDHDDDDVEEHLLGGAARLGEMESILTLCEARGLGSRMLKWHYRSRDPSLISVSNREFYQNSLILPPSPLQKDGRYGLCFTRVDGVYDKGGRRDNRIEGETIIARVAEHARKYPSLSLGIVTFSFAQRNLITELLELVRRHDPTLDAFLREGHAEDLFVKNIENVQGDERDVILISMGYGPVVPGGRLTSMSFGPVNAEGGERRLNVLFTRARVRCEIFASFDPGDIDISKTAGEGLRILRRFLDFAKTGRLNDSVVSGRDADSPLEEDVADTIRSFGFLADPQVGSAGFRIDIGVRHPDRPGTYLMAVECDGATYHSALWARERDRLRQDVLENLGWRFHRVWSTDWFYNRQAETGRLRQALDDAREAAGQGTDIAGANGAPAAATDLPGEEDGFDLPEAIVRQMPAYKRALFPVNSAQEPHDVPVRSLAALARRIVDVEGPVATEEVARRLAACFGKEKAGSRILSAAAAALNHAKLESPTLLSDGVFWFTREQKEAALVRDRSAEAGATMKAGNISMMEIEAALRIAREDNGGGADGDLIRTAARLLGFRRVGPDLHARLSAGLADASLP